MSYPECVDLHQTMMEMRLQISQVHAIFSKEYKTAIRGVVLLCEQLHSVILGEIVVALDAAVMGSFPEGPFVLPNGLPLMNVARGIGPLNAQQVPLPVNRGGEEKPNSLTREEQTFVHGFAVFLQRFIRSVEAVLPQDGDLVARANRLVSKLMKRCAVRD